MIPVVKVSEFKKTVSALGKKSSVLATEINFKFPMNTFISNFITSALPFRDIGNDIYIQHPTLKNVEEISKLLSDENLDLRRLVPISNDFYPSQGEKWIRDKWKETFDKFKKNQFNANELFSLLSDQAEGILNYQPIPSKKILIRDPFNMTPVEQQKSILDLATEQMANTIIVQNDSEIIGVGRLLEVEGSVEIVSLFTKAKWRRKGIASKIVDELLERSKVRPVYSFQVPELVPFYLKKYQKHGVVRIEPISQIPRALQRDLFYMNIFWGPHTIISIK